MHLSDAIDKGRLSAYQRWEMTSFEDKPPPLPPPPPPPPPPQPKITLAEIALIKENARQEGYAKGLEEGQQLGFDTGLAEGQEAVTLQLNAIEAIAVQFSTARKQADILMAQDVLDVALHLAKAMLQQALAVNPELLLPVVQHAIAAMPSVQQPAQLFLCPADAGLVRNAMGAELQKAGWAICSDTHMQTGDCRIETAKNQIDASLATRWKDLTAALARDITWYTRYSGPAT